jgi:2'-5' RNA ligase
MTEPTRPPRKNQDQDWRLFVAIPLPDDVKEALGAISARLQKGARFVGQSIAWTAMDSLHLTLAFLGSTPPGQAGPIAEALRPVAARFGPQRLEIKRLGVFPHWHSPRVLWTGVRDRSHQLEALSQAVSAALADFGYVPDGRPFHPHLTLGRFKSLKGADAIERLVRQHTDFRIGPFIAPQMVLFRSELLPAGAQHTALERMTFEQPPAWHPGAEEESDDE